MKKTRRKSRPRLAVLIALVLFLVGVLMVVWQEETVRQLSASGMSSVSTDVAMAAKISAITTTTVKTSSTMNPKLVAKIQTSLQALREKNAATANQIEPGCFKDPLPIHEFDSLPSDPGFNCSYSQEQTPEAFVCGETCIFTHPYQWECRLKSRLFSLIDHAKIRNSLYTGIDLGAAFGDWVIVVGAYSPSARLVAIETGEETFRGMYWNLMTNPGLSERVLAYHAAVASTNAAYFGNGEIDDAALLLDENQLWKGPTMCLQVTAKDSGKTKTSIKGEGSNNNETDLDCTKEVPAITIDAILLEPSLPKGSLFFVKVDIEGGEFSALQGGNATFRNPSERPCVVYAELKITRSKERIPIYDRVFELMTQEYGYTDYVDIDSGLRSYPPIGKIWGKEGNYEFRLPVGEYAECEERVRMSGDGKR